MKRLCRTEGPDALLCGVCGGIARYFNVDPTVVRVATVLLVAFAGLSLWVYIIAALIMPKEWVLVNEFVPDSSRGPLLNCLLESPALCSGSHEMKCKWMDGG